MYDGRYCRQGAGFDVNRYHSPTLPLDVNPVPEAVTVQRVFAAHQPDLLVDYHHQGSYVDDDDEIPLRGGPVHAEPANAGCNTNTGDTGAASWTSHEELGQSLAGIERRSGGTVDVNRDYHPDLAYVPQPGDFPGTSAEPGWYIQPESRPIRDVFVGLQREFGRYDALASAGESPFGNITLYPQDINLPGTGLGTFALNGSGPPPWGQRPLRTAAVACSSTRYRCGGRTSASGWPTYSTTTP